MECKLYRFAVLTGVLGLAAMLSGAVFPDILYRILTPAGLLLLFLSCGLFTAWWIASMTGAVKSENYPYATALLAVGLIVIFRNALRFL